MSLTDHKIDEAVDYEGRDIASLEDTPLLSPKQLKARFDSLVKNLVVPRYNALIDELGAPAHVVSEGTEGNIPCFDETGDLMDSGVSRLAVEPRRNSGYISARSDETWYRIAVFHIPFAVANGRNFRIDGYSGLPVAEGCGHWSVAVSVTHLGNANRKLCRLIFADDGISPDNFDFRQTGDGEFALWFKPVAGTDYAVFAQINGDAESSWIELLTNDTTPVAGLYLPVDISVPASVRMGIFRALVSASAEFTDFTVPWAKKGKPVVVLSNDASPKVIPKSASCESNGIVRVYWTTVPSSDVSAALSIFYGV